MHQISNGKWRAQMADCRLDLLRCLKQVLQPDCDGLNMYLPCQPAGEMKSGVKLQLAAAPPVCLLILIMKSLLAFQFPQRGGIMPHICSLKSAFRPGL